MFEGNVLFNTRVRSGTALFTHGIVRVQQYCGAQSTNNGHLGLVLVDALESPKYKIF